MDDLFKVLMYILAVIIYALFKMKRKKPVQYQQPSQKPKQTLPHTTPAKSYADEPPRKTAPSLDKSIKKLEKEINKSKEIIKPERHIKSGKVYEEKRYEGLERENLEKETLTYESPARDYQSNFDKFQTFSEIQNYESDLTEKSIVFEYPEEENINSNPYAEFLKNPENVKKAIVMKEIFDRKHF